MTAASPAESLALADHVESVLRFGDGEAALVGILCRPRGEASVGVVVVPGGAQNRCGSARRFVTLARAFAARGIAVLRFDYAGMGDSPGPLPVFEAAGDDVGRAVRALRDACPSVRTVVAWGLCDGATAALLRAATDPAIDAVVGVNPWARTEAGRSAALVRTHYRARLASPAFWGRVARGEVDVRGAAADAARHLLAAVRTAPPRRTGGDRTHADGPALRARLADRARPLPERLHEALAARPFPVLAIVAPGDLTGAEFERAMQPRCEADAGRVDWLRIDGGDHSLSERAHWDAALTRTIDWIGRLR